MTSPTNITTRTPNALEGKVAVVLGASSGIGECIAKTLAREGAKVCIGARRESNLKKIVGEINANNASNGDGNGTAIYRCTDATDRQSVKALVQAAIEEFGTIDIMVNNAGIMPFTYMKNLQEEEWEKMVDVNCKGVLNGIGACLKHFLDKKSGHIVNMSSDAGKQAFSGLAVYSGTKFFVEGLSNGLRTEIAKDGVRVTCVQPGDVATDLAQTTTDMEAFKDLADTSGYTTLQTQDIANAVLYAVTQPPFVAINQILIEPREMPIA